MLGKEITFLIVLGAKHSVTLRTDTTCMHPEDLHCTAHKHKGRDAGFGKRGCRESCKESCVKENLTLSCMLCIEHRCAVSVISLKPENKSPFQVPLQMFRGCFHFFDVPGSHSHVLLSKRKNDE